MPWKRIYIRCDTVNRAARDASVNAIAVATGVYKASGLIGSDLVLNNFKEEKKLMGEISNGAAPAITKAKL